MPPSSHARPSVATAVITPPVPGQERSSRTAYHAFDPYPYILLNLVLSCLAALQAPIIMMSQNRVAQRDRMEADEDFKINLKAELEIGGLHEKVDHLLHVQWARLVEIQQAQLELLSELANRQPRSAE
jgi:uncharacterized membrane protein